ncbi:hypothetical protein OXX80_003656 [Metschnikowia pulcherrima]
MCASVGGAPREMYRSHGAFGYSVSWCMSVKMSVLDEILRFFSLETLDTRLHAPNDMDKKKAVMARANPESRWHTLEFRLYLLVFAMVVPLMYKTAMDASNETNPNYTRFQHLLSDGWMFGRKVDNSDQQYKFLRDNFWLIWAILLSHTALRRAVYCFYTPKRTTFDFCFGCVYLITLHGTNNLRIALHVVVMFSMAKLIDKPRTAKTCLWAYGVLSLFMNHWFKDMATNIRFIDNGFHGIVPRWDVFYNFTLLRIISFSMDYLDSKNKDKLLSEEDINLGSASPIKLEASTMPSDLDDRRRLDAPIPMVDYSFSNFVAYLSYAPLFIGGPVITFNDYLYQSNYHSAPSTKDFKRIMVYGVRLMFCVLVMEFLLHFMYVVAVSKAKAWDGDTPFQISMLGLFNLNIIWLKLLIPWRLFRFWSLLDGIDPPENMIRCMDNNYSAVSFWRAWHRSFNKWVLRYIYIPMGGAGAGTGGYISRIVNSLLVFSFVAIWHDIELKLLMWGWLVVLFLLPEIFATAYFKKYNKKPWYRHLCAVGAVINIWMMMIANLYGFCLGNDGTAALLRALVSTSSGLTYFVLSSCALFVGAQVMFEMREAEKRRGVDVKC